MRPSVRNTRTWSRGPGAFAPGPPRLCSPFSGSPWARRMPAALWRPTSRCWQPEAPSWRRCSGTNFRRARPRKCGSWTWTWRPSSNTSTSSTPASWPGSQQTMANRVECPLLPTLCRSSEIPYIRPVAREWLVESAGFLSRGDLEEDLNLDNILEAFWRKAVPARCAFCRVLRC